MLFPLQEKKIIRGCAEHIAAGLGCAADYVADYVPFRAPFDGVIYWFNENAGGEWVTFKRDDGLKIELAHLSQRSVGHGSRVFKGQQCGMTGNTGTVTTGPHLHLQVKDTNGKRIDPESLPWETTMYENKVARNTETGEYALILGGKRRKVTEKRSGFASITIQQRKMEFIDLPPSTFNSIPAGQDF